MNQSRGRKSISAKYQKPRHHQGERPRGAGGANVEYKRIQSLGVDVLKARGISREVVSVIGRWLVFKHLTDLEAEAARRYAYIMARFDKYFTEGRRTAKSPSYERAFGQDQELEQRAFDGSLKFYEKSAKKAKRQYDKLQTIMGIYADPMTGRNPLKNAIDEMCCEDLEPPAEYRTQIAAVLRHVAHEFGVTAQSRRGRPRKGAR